MVTSHELMAQGEIIRQKSPILWGILRGRGSKYSLALLLGCGPKKIQQELDNLVEQKQIRQNQRDGYTHVYHLDQEGPQYEDWVRLRNFYQRVELAVIEASGQTPKKLGNLVSSGAEKAWAEQNPEQKKTESNSRWVRVDPEGTCTPNQAALMVLLSNKWGYGEHHKVGAEGGAAQRASGRTFTPKEAAQAQGYAQPGYTGQKLLGLANKGFLEMLDDKGRHWKLTLTGLAKAKQLKELGVEPAHRYQGVPEVDPSEF